MATLKNTTINSTGALQLPSGTTAQRPASNTAGTMRFNSSFNTVETWNGSRWFYGPDIVRNGLVLHLDAGEPSSYPGTGTTWTDLSGNGNNASLTNGPTYNSGNGGSIVFDGVDDYVPLSQTIIPQNITVNIWFNTNVISAYKILIRWRLYGMGLSIGSPGIISLFLYDSSSTVVSIATTTNYIETGKIYNASFTFGNSKLSLYVNGALIETKNASSNSIYYILDALSPTIGKDGAGSGDTNFNGKIYATSIYNRALTATEIQQNFNAMRGRYGL